MACRRATRGGSWYSASREKLSGQLTSWLSNVDALPCTEEGRKLSSANIRAIIAPHAGYAYSGQAAAWAYANLNVDNVQTIFILGPSHHKYLTGCALSTCLTYSTPLGDLTIDSEITESLYETDVFEWMDISTDEMEHSIEMHLPYIKHIINRAGRENHIRIVPVLVGSTSFASESTYGTIFAPYLADPKNLFVISSDFCHWGQRFQYTMYTPNANNDLKTLTMKKTQLRQLTVSTTKKEECAIWESIAVLDHAGINAIESLSHQSFTDYIKVTKNTICGRHPIGIMLASLGKLTQSKNITINKRKAQDGSQPEGNLRHEKTTMVCNETPMTADVQNLHIKFVHYAQSSQCRALNDSSVSYASAYVYMP